MVSWLARLWWVFDLTTHFRVQYLLFLAAGALFFLWQRDVGFAFVSIFFSISNLAVILPLYFRHAEPATGTRRLRLVAANVLQPNQDHSRVRELARNWQPDLIALVETNSTWLDELQELRVNYPYWHTAAREDHYGLAFLSRIPILNAETCSFCDKGVPTIIARLELDGAPLTCIVTHPPPPKGAQNSAYRNQQFEGLARFACMETGVLLLCGDLNTSPWSPYFKRLLNISGLADSERGFGVQPTWPAGQPYFWTPIDHCLVSSGVTILNRRIGARTGSDHYPLIIDLAF